ncbi:hypothetical protein LTR94_038165, partial [Friedmanniomyces endolithicus]
GRHPRRGLFPEQRKRVVRLPYRPGAQGRHPRDREADAGIAGAGGRAQGTGLQVRGRRRGRALERARQAGAAGRHHQGR